MIPTSTRLAAAMGLLALIAVTPARAGYTLPAFFVDDPTKNSQEWTAAVTAEGGKINSSVNFQTMSLGALNDAFYNTPASVGVTLFASDSSFNQVVSGPGPDQGGKTGPVSAGEGASSYSDYLQSISPGTGGRSSLTISFATPVMAVGLFTIDYFGSDTSMSSLQVLTNTLTFAIYSGANGTGTLLGTATAVRDNFQPDGLYFMGYASSSDDIGSAVLLRGPDLDGDTIGVGGIDFATGVPLIEPVPEPSSLALLGLGAACVMGAAARRRGRRAA